MLGCPVAAALAARRRPVVLVVVGLGEGLGRLNPLSPRARWRSSTGSSRETTRGGACAC